MSEKLKKRLALAGKIVGGTIIIIPLVCWLIGTLLMLRWNIVNNHKLSLLRNGPWGEQSIWVSEDESVRMVSRRAEGSREFGDVRVYLSKDGETTWCQLFIADGSDELIFGYNDSTHGADLFTCKASLRKGNTELVLKNFSDGAAAYLPEGTKKVALTKQPYGEYPGTMPQFDYS